MPDDTYPMFTDPQGNTPGGTAELIGSILGGRGLLGRSLTGFGALANRRAYEQWEQANRGKQLDMFERHGLITKEDRQRFDPANMPTAAWEPIGQKYDQALEAITKPRAPMLFYDANSGRMVSHTPQEGEVMPQGLLTPGIYNAQQTQQERQDAAREHEREFGINKNLQEQNFAATMGLRREALTASEREHADSLALRREEHAAGAGKPQISWRTETDSSGRTTQVPYRFDPATGSEVPVNVAGSPGGLRGRLDASQQKQVDAIHEVENTLPLVQEYVNALPPNTTPAVMAREYAKYRAPFGALGAPSKEFTDYFDILGQLKPTLMGARMGGLSRSGQLLSKLSPHIPDPLDPPKRAMEKMQAFQRGAFDSTMSAIIGSGGAPPPPAIMGGSMPTPPASMIPEGHKRTFTNGKTYQNVGGVVTEVNP